MISPKINTAAEAPEAVDPEMSINADKVKEEASSAKTVVGGSTTGTASATATGSTAGATTAAADDEDFASPKDNKEQGNVNKFVKEAISVDSKFATHTDGNITNQYIFNIDKMSGDISSVQKDRLTIKNNPGAKSYKLHERQDCSEFVYEYKTSLHLAYAIAVALLEYVPISDLQKLSDSLLRRFPKTLDAEGKEVHVYRSPFISLDDIINIIGARICSVAFSSPFGDVTERCVYFENARDRVIGNIWELFPMLRSEITGWLIETDSSFSFRTAFNTRCFVNAIVNIVKLDFGDSINRLFQQLVSREENKLLIIRLMLELIKVDDTKKNACELLRKWASSPVWLWEVALVVYSRAEEELSYTNELERLLTRKLLNSTVSDWNDWSIFLIGGQMISSARLRSLIAAIMHKLIAEKNEDNSINHVCLIYLLLVSNAYKFIDKNNTALPLVAVDNKKQLEDLAVLAPPIFSDYILRHSLFMLLEAYLIEINGYTVTDALLNRLKSYFYIIAKRLPRYINDIKRFYAQASFKNNKTAKSIYQFLDDKFLLNKKELAKL